MVPHPLAGLAAGFSGVAAVFLVNVFVTPTDALLVEVTNDAIRTVNPEAQITVVGNLFFMIALSILMGIICNVLTERFVEPRRDPYTGGVPVGASTGLSGSEEQGLTYAGRAFLGFVVLIGLLTAPPPPCGILRNQETGGIMAGSPFMSGLISLCFLMIGYAYGKGAGTIANVTAAIGLNVKTWSNLSGMIFLLFVIANFIAFFNYTNLATVLAVTLADFLQTTSLGATTYIILFVIVVAVIDIILTGALAKWAILAPVFVPLFMRLGGDPNLVLAAYRVGDSPMNVITPLAVYLAVMVGFANKYPKDAGIGTLVALMLPFTIVLLVTWTLMLVLWSGNGAGLRPQVRAGCCRRPIDPVARANSTLARALQRRPQDVPVPCQASVVSDKYGRRCVSKPVRARVAKFCQDATSALAWLTLKSAGRGVRGGHELGRSAATPASAAHSTPPF